MSIKVIGAGIGRTGTHSLKLALEELGFGKCYHMENLIMDHPERVSFWKDLRAGKEVDHEDFFKGYQSAVDVPVFPHYKQFIQWYPDARVILTVRDPESWYKSFGDTIIRSSRPSMGKIVRMSLRLPFNKTLRQRLSVLRFAGAYLKDFFPKGFENKEAALRFYHDWNQAVIDAVPKEKLLVYNLKEGWEPLCRFLNVPVPQKEMPHSNTTDEFLERKM
ncbi:MAG TPA: sulfotransferase [Saprospiraceae bacterium]|nr:sulfotransferase [Saprospiraceae bacterium]